ncbi:peptide-methionine (S)-S-oxide reductase MsrA [Gordonia jinhuaensis]|uniref:peptide-methionine (S)-S-oxide reductase MsrA n=1 Tax=Gordonia jinhuaensis TaxID=1517702 RepID=UPI001E5527A3|nr:peptide-methionine (S)-S-oxide reductase MsrA [Gordonia jinhuaensis]
MTGESLRSLGEGVHAIVLAGGCFWGVDDRLRHLPGVLGTAAGYAGGHTPDPTYEQVCRGHTGYAESVLVVFDPRVLPLERVLAAFWEMHDPTQGMRQGNDIGSQYRSAIYTADECDARLARQTMEVYQHALTRAGESAPITTEIGELAETGDGRFHFAEDHHQQYLVKHPAGYRCDGTTGVSYPTT